MPPQQHRVQRSDRRPPATLGRSAADITPLTDLEHGRSRTGPTRAERPVYVDLLPPCNAGCPAGENIQGWMAHVKAGEHEQAWRLLTAENPFPAIHGRVCYHPCESVCNRAELDSALSIHAVERFLGDLALERAWLFDPPRARSGKRVLVIGAGPSGLSAAYHLARARPRGRDSRCRPRAGRDDALRDSRLPDAEGCDGRRGRSDRRARGAVHR